MRGGGMAGCANHSCGSGEIVRKRSAAWPYSTPLEDEHAHSPFSSSTPVFNLPPPPPGSPPPHPVSTDRSGP
eukprot:7380792-Prymnesium_polylepis.1